MSWLNSFDPAAPKPSASSTYGDTFARNVSQRRIQPSSSSSNIGPSTARLGSGQPAPGLPQTGRTTRLYPSSSAGPSSSTHAPRPRPPQPRRIRAAPPAAALRSEDAQPNENEARTKPWEIAAPPSIGKAKSSMAPPRLPGQGRPQQQRSGLPPRPAAPQASGARSLPQRPPQPGKVKPHQPQERHQQSHSGPGSQSTQKLSKKQRKRLRRQEQEQIELRRLQRQQEYTQQPPAKKAKVEGSSSQSAATSHVRASPQQARSQSHHSSHDSQISEGIRTPSSPPATPPLPKASVADGIASSGVQAEPGAQGKVSPNSGVSIPTLSQLHSILAMVSKSPEKGRQQQQQQQGQTPQQVQSHAPQQSRAEKGGTEQARLAEEARKAEEAKWAEQARQADQLRQAEEARKAEQARAQQARLAERARRAEEARQAEELALYLEQLTDDESAVSTVEEPASLPFAPKQASDSRPSASKASTATVSTQAEEDELLDETRASVSAAQKKGKRVDVGDSSDDDDDDDRPLADALYASATDAAQSSISSSRARHLDTADSDPEEDVPLRDLLQRRSSEAPSTANPHNDNDTASKWPSTPFDPKITRLFSGAAGMSIRYFVPIASSALEASSRAIVRNRAAVFDAAIAVGEHGKIATFAEKTVNRSTECEAVLPGRLMEFQADLEGRSKTVKGTAPIDRVEDVSRLTSKVCGIASSTKKPLGLGNHADYPCQVSLVTVNDTGRAHRTYHLDERPHARGVASIARFPRTDPADSTSVDFATGGIDGIVSHWHWRARSTRADTLRLHTLHDTKPVVALEHLASRCHTLASASLGTVVGYDLAALTLGWSWNTSDRIVHLQRTPDAKLMLGVLARRDYDQFRMFDVTGGNGPISRPVISFGWLNDSEGKLPLGRGSFHPTRRAIFAHGAEDGHVRVWDMRNARDPLIDVRLGDEPIVEAVWGCAGGGGEARTAEDLLYVASPKGVRSVSLLAP